MPTTFGCPISSAISVTTRGGSRSGHCFLQANHWKTSPTPSPGSATGCRVPQPSTYFLLWFTKASTARDQPDRFQIEISDIELLG